MAIECNDCNEARSYLRDNDPPQVVWQMVADLCSISWFVCKRVLTVCSIGDLDGLPQFASQIQSSHFFISIIALVEY